MVFYASNIHWLQEISTVHNDFQKSQKHSFLGLNMKNRMQTELTKS